MLSVIEEDLESEVKEDSGEGGSVGALDAGRLILRSPETPLLKP